MSRVGGKRVLDQLNGGRNHAVWRICLPSLFLFWTGDGVLRWDPSYSKVECAWDLGTRFFERGMGMLLNDPMVGEDRAIFVSKRKRPMRALQN